MSQIQNQGKRPLQRPATANQAVLPAPDYDRLFGQFRHTAAHSSNNADSNGSSPTTTVSTEDDSSATEPSPGSSPESPPPKPFADGMLRSRVDDDSKCTFFELQKQPPPRKGRNLKNLAVNTSRPNVRAASTTSLPLEAQYDLGSTLLSPSFVKPSTPFRRKPNNLGLTILTPGLNKPSQDGRLAVPSTPLGIPGTLRHFQSSPSLSLVPGPGLQHDHHHDVNAFPHRTQTTLFSPIEFQENAQAEEEDRNFDVPLSQEEKPEAYPDGPICVYEPNIDLYLEPTADQARRYDVVMNVAVEVRNPFIMHNEPVAKEPELVLDGGGGIRYAPQPQLLNLGKSTGPASHESTPTTPKATPPTTNIPPEAFSRLAVSNPEYIHVPWEHNSDIVPDLFRLVKLIDEKVLQGKRVLIHCQCGVSRSASLVVAYGLYKTPSMSVQEAYDAVKRKSKWIGPNMNLIMQLQEFRSSLARGGVLSGNRALSPVTPSSASSDWDRPSSTIPSPRPRGEDRNSAVVDLSKSQALAGNVSALAPGSSSAPSGLPWPATYPQRGRSVSAMDPTTAYVDPSGRVLPVLNVMDTDHSYTTKPVSLREAVSMETRSPESNQPAPETCRSLEFAMAPLNPSADVDSADRFGILSPSSTEFPSNPFDRSTLLAALGMGSIRVDEESPRNSLLLRNREDRTGSRTNTRRDAQPSHRIRGKVSSPTIREQQQLQKLQATIEATLSTQNASTTQHGRNNKVDDDYDDDALLSPRATEFTNNPFALTLSIPPSNFGSNNSTRPTDSAVDPRSPALKGANPIFRSILDVL